MGRNGAGVRAASDSTIEITFTYQGARCRERLALQPTPANLKRATRHKAAIEAAIEGGTFDYAVTFPESARAKKFARLPGDVTLTGIFLQEWLARVEPTLAASTYADYKKTVSGPLDTFAKQKLTEIDQAAMEDFCAKLTCGNKRIGNILSVLRIALDNAKDRKLILINPVTGFSYEKNEPPKVSDDIDPFTIEERAAILGKLEGQAFNLVQVAFWSGLRTSELVALDWRHIDFRRGLILVREARTQAAKGKIETTKTAAGTREVKMLPLARAALEAQKAWTFLKGVEVFQNPRTGERWSGDQPIRKTMWTHALKRAEVRYRYPYQTRHTFASMMLSAGEHPMWVAQQMGHEDWGLIRRRYGKWMPDAAPNAGSAADALFGSGAGNRIEKQAQ